MKEVLKPPPVPWSTNMGIVSRIFGRSSSSAGFDRDAPLTFGRVEAPPVQQSKDAYARLVAHPRDFLAENAVTVVAGKHPVTEVNDDVLFEYNLPGSLTINAEENASLRSHATKVSAIVSPTRVARLEKQLNYARLQPAEVFTAGHSGPRLWVTDQQSGCTLMMLYWGPNQYSMVHLLPHQTSDYAGLTAFVLGMGANRTSKSAAVLREIKNPIAAAVQNARLRGDAKAVVANSVAEEQGQQPLKYMMVQSQHNTNVERRAQVIGVNTGDDWRFFVQTLEQVYRNGAAQLGVKKVDELAWKVWNGKFSSVW